MMPTHTVDATSRATALPVPDAPAFPDDLDEALSDYTTRQRAAAEKLLAAGDADLATVRDTVPSILRRYREQLAVVGADRDLTPQARDRKRVELLSAQRDELAALVPKLHAATARAQTFAPLAPSTEADARVLAELIRQKNELSARQFLP